MHGILLAMLGDAHVGIFFLFLLGEISRDPALLRLGHADHQRPIDLARRAGTEAFRQGRCSKAGFSPPAGRPAVSLSRRCTRRGALRVGVIAAQGFEHVRRCSGRAPEPPCTARPAGLFKTSTSSSSDNVIERMNSRSLLRLGRVVAQLRRPRAATAGYARLARFQPVLGLGAFAIHPHFAFADDALDVTERQAGKARLKETVDPHIVLVRCHGDVLHAGGEEGGFGWRGGRRRERLPALRALGAPGRRDPRFGECFTRRSDWRGLARSLNRSLDRSRLRSSRSRPVPRPCPRPRGAAVFLPPP